MGNLDGCHRGLVYSTSQKKAAEAAKTGISSFRDYWHVQDQGIPGDFKPDTLYSQPIGERSSPWVEGLCELPKRNR